ncbi:cytochrome oxidase biogenesis protein Surf1, facilitates heme A insertion [Sulfitobacter alexandrii]|uniref:SURF1-like protein n=1 Tax=Sulfitobacter alexandrii TaxID=1917485 RepID=A0A1J0WIM6_9RHOB|nr:SURF1 family protein [Sulfitobacter alexandrii]APE44183.1 cytochrome oxidase biogenesis protein Surf1, facilitates heme A insertion [Sulfitobacter alexandrii]
MSRALFVILIGLGGAAILIGLGIWQVQRLAWKEGVLADINARIEAPAQALPDRPDPETDAYLPVEVTGTLEGATLRVLVSQKDEGAGYRLISAMDTGARRILVDRGFIPTAADMPGLPQGAVTVTGNLQWPQETDSFTPEPDRAANIWFARDVQTMAETLDTEPVLVVARAVSWNAAPVTPLPVDTARIPNDHLQYAITWFSLAAIWLAMSFYFLRRRAKIES